MKKIIPLILALALSTSAIAQINISNGSGTRTALRNASINFTSDRGADSLIFLVRTAGTTAPTQATLLQTGERMAQTIVAGVNSDIDIYLGQTGIYAARDLYVMVVRTIPTITYSNMLKIEIPEFPNWGSGAVTLTDGQIWTENITLTQATTITVAAGNTATISGIISGEFQIIKAGEGTLILTGANTYSGTTLIFGGTLQVGNGTSGSINSTSTVSIASDATLRFVNNAIMVFSKVIYGAGKVEKAGTGVLFLSADNTYTGTTTVEEGSISIGTIMGSTGSIAGNIVLANPGTLLAYSRTGNSTYSGVISGQGDVEIVFGTVTLTGANTYTGKTIVTTGTLQIGNGTSGSIANTSNVELLNTTATLRFEPGADMTFDKVISGKGKVEYKGTNSKMLTFTAGNTYTGTTTIDSLSVFNLGNDTIQGFIVGDIINNGYFNFSCPNDYTYAGVISGRRGINKFSAGTLTLTAAAHTSTGSLSVNFGTLNLQGNWAGNLSVNIVNYAKLTVTGNCTIGGSLYLLGGATNFDLTSATPSKLTVLGTVTANNVTMLNVTVPTTPLTDMVLIQAASGITTTNAFAVTLAGAGSANTPTLSVNATPNQLRLSTEEQALEPFLKIGTTTYNSWQAAVAAVTAGQTIEMTRNTGVNFGWNRAFDKDIAYTIDLGGFTYLGCMDIVSGNVTIKNGEINESGEWNAINTGATVTLEALTVWGGIDNHIYPGTGTINIISGTYANDAGCVLQAINNGTVNITSGTFTLHGTEAAIQTYVFGSGGTPVINLAVGSSAYPTGSTTPYANLSDWVDNPAATDVTVMPAPVPTYAVTVENGTTTAATFEEGATVAITANTPATGKQFDQWTTTDGVTFANASQASTTFVMPAKPVTVTATYKDLPPNTYTVTVQNDGNGTANAAPASATAGTEITLTATPAEGYKFKEWQVISGSVTIANNKFTMPANNVVVKAFFEALPPTYFKITITQPSNGTISVKTAANVTVNSGDTLVEGTQLVLTATANTGYEFVKWLHDNHDQPNHTHSLNDHITFSAEFSQANSIRDAQKEMLLVVYPNPTNGELQITKSTNNQITKVEIYDMNGRLVFVAPFTIHHSPFTVNVQHLPQGTYFVRIGTQTAKIVKK
jgi:autotransporter-associated beta strand protein